MNKGPVLGARLGEGGRVISFKIPSSRGEGEKRGKVIKPTIRIQKIIGPSSKKTKKTKGEKDFQRREGKGGMQWVWSEGDEKRLKISKAKSLAATFFLFGRGGGRGIENLEKNGGTASLNA